MISCRTLLAALIAIVAVLGGCDKNAARDSTAAARSRAQAVPAARALYRAMRAANARSVDLLDWGYQPCGTGASTLAYSVSMRVFAFTTYQNTNFDAYQRQVVSIVRADGWTLRQRPPTRSVLLPAVPSAYYRLSRRDHHVTGTVALAGDVNPQVGVSGTISINGPCLDAGGAAKNLQSREVTPPFPAHS